MPRATDPAATAAGFVAAEGTFGLKKAGGFRFAIAVGATDAAMCEAIQHFLGVGHIYWYRRRKDHYDDEVTFVVQSLRDLVEVIVPFMDEHLLPCHKRAQYEAWRADLLEYWDHGAKRRRSCSVDGCEQPRRAKGFCRRHYYERFGV